MPVDSAPDNDENVSGGERYSAGEDDNDSETLIGRRLAAVNARIRQAQMRFGRPECSVTLLAVSKTKPVADIEAAWFAGQRCFGENYPQELAEKARALATRPIEWHMIGPIQANKTALVAQTCDWVHSVDRLKIARRLSQHRAADRPPINVLIQVNIDREPTKHGFDLDELPGAAAEINGLANLKLRGLMAIPAPRAGFDEQRLPFARLRLAFEQLTGPDYGLDLDTLSIGMTDDCEAAIAEGSTLVRIGSAIFGARIAKSPPPAS